MTTNIRMKFLYKLGPSYLTHSLSPYLRLCSIPLVRLVKARVCLNKYKGRSCLPFCPLFVLLSTHYPERKKENWMNYVVSLVSLRRPWRQRLISEGLTLHNILLWMWGGRVRKVIAKWSDLWFCGKNCHRDCGYELWLFLGVSDPDFLI